MLLSSVRIARSSFLVWLTLGSATLCAQELRRAEIAEVSFLKTVAPILVRQCVACHRADLAEGGLRLDTVEQMLKGGDSGALFVPGDASSSELFSRLVIDDLSLRMPLDAAPIPADDVNHIRNWINAGAKVESLDPTLRLAEAIGSEPNRPAPASYRRSLPITSIAFLDEQRLLVGGYRECLVVDLASEQIQRVAGLPERLYSVEAFAIREHAETGEAKGATHVENEWSLFAAGGSPGVRGSIRLINPNDSDRNQSLATTTDVFWCVEVSPTREHLAASSSSGEILIWPLQDLNGEPIRNQSHSDWVTKLVWNRSGDQLVTFGRDGSTKVIDTLNGEVIASFSQHEAAVCGGAFVGENDVISVDRSGMVRRWDTAKVNQLKANRIGREAIVAELDSDERLWVALDSERIVTVDVRSCDRVGEPVLLPAKAVSMAIGPAGKTLAVGAENGWVYLVDLESRKLRESFCPLPGWTQFGVDDNEQESRK